MVNFPSPTATFHSKGYPAIAPTRPELSVKGKTVLVTGGGSGIGAETARYFAQAGATRIALLGRREQPLLDTKASILDKFPSIEVFTASTDVTKKPEVDAAFDQFLGGGRKLDILISAAAVIGPQESVTEADPDGFLKGIEQNLAGSLYVARAFARYAAPKATAVDVSSSAAHVNFGMCASYSIAKWAVYRLWDMLAFQFPDLRVFHIQPGIVDTAMNRSTGPAGGIAAAGHEDDAGFSVWLASPEADFLKGKFLWTNWDVEELKTKADDIQKGNMLNIDLVGWPFTHGGNDWKFEAQSGTW
ncbi:hypothetical protein KJ359_004153 [Pestalotiopsis sp. 9143b]|nr:hypothetical protein KJ359_004153 [Pestalotiopsis sp. 9143b]